MKKIIDWKIDSKDVEKPFCHICKKDTELFKVPDEDWFNFVPKNLQDKIICKKCYLGLVKTKNRKNLV